MPPKWPLLPGEIMHCKCPICHFGYINQWYRLWEPKCKFTYMPLATFPLGNLNASSPDTRVKISNSVSQWEPKQNDMQIYIHATSAYRSSWLSSSLTGRWSQPGNGARMWRWRNWSSLPKRRACRRRWERCGLPSCPGRWLKRAQTSSRVVPGPWMLPGKEKGFCTCIE